jgi:hypothetical protein
MTGSKEKLICSLWGLKKNGTNSQSTYSDITYQSVGYLAQRSQISAFPRITLALHEICEKFDKYEMILLKATFPPPLNLTKFLLKG